MASAEWQVANLDEIAQPGAREFRVGEGDWPFKGIVVRWGVAVYAYSNSCAHLGHPLNFEPDRFFSPDQKFLLCGSHGALFEPDTGLCISGPCLGASLRSLTCRVAGNHVFVEAPDSMRSV
jgi:nitrite reductase/ring-hydroxylating ferredoxin subunit